MYSGGLFVRKQTILMIMTTFPLLMSEGMIELMHLNNNVVILIRLVSACILALLCLHNKYRPGYAMWILYAIYVSIIFTSRFHGNLMTSFSSLLNCFLMCVVFDFWLNYEYEDFLIYMRRVLFILVIINFMTIILFPNGLYGTGIYSVNWLLGHKNSHLNYIMMSIILESINAFKYHNKIRFTTSLYMILCCFSLYTVDSATAFIIVTVYVVFLILFVNFSESKYIKLLLDIASVRTIIIVMLVITTIVVFMQDMEFVANTFSGLFDSMNRDTHFTGRTVIWAQSIEVIKENLWFGQGVVDSVLFGKMTGFEAGTHAHNYILNILVMGGILCLLEHVVLYVYTIKKITSSKSFYAYTLGLAIGLYFVSGLTGVNFYSALFNPIFVLTHYVLTYEE